MKRILFAMMLALIAIARPVGATVGGEWLCEVMGFEPSTQRVYVQGLNGSGASSFGFVAWMPIAGDSAGVLHGVDWDRTGEGTAQDPELLRQVEALRARLVPLRLLPWPALPFAQKVVARDSVPNPMRVERRLVVRASFDSQLALDVTCWGSETVARSATYELPGGAGWIWVVAFIGDPFEVGYETQEPVLVRPGDRGIRSVEWRPNVD